MLKPLAQAIFPCLGPGKCPGWPEFWGPVQIPVTVFFFYISWKKLGKKKKLENSQSCENMSLISVVKLKKTSNKYSGFI